MMKLRSVLLIGITTAASALPTWAISSEATVAPPQVGGLSASMRVAIDRYEKSREASRVDRASVITEYYQKNPEQRPVVVVVDNDDNGRRGRGRGRGGGNMPPGWEKKLAKHGELPGDLRTHVVIVPVALVRSLPALPRGQEYAIVGNRVVVIERSSFLVLDIVAKL